MVVALPKLLPYSASGLVLITPVLPPHGENLRINLGDVLMPMKVPIAIINLLGKVLLSVLFHWRKHPCASWQEVRMSCRWGGQ